MSSLTTPFPTSTTLNSTLYSTFSSLPTSNITTAINIPSATGTPSASTTGTQSHGTNESDIFDPPPGSIASSAQQNQNGLSTQLIICTSVGLLFFLIFCFLRTRWPVIFAPRKSMKRRKPPTLPDSFFGWIIPLIRISKTEMLDKVGLDAVIMLDFIVMSIKIFGLCSFFGVVVLIPISATTGNFTDPLLSSVDHLSITVVKESSPYLIAYLVFTYFFTFVTWFFLQQNYDSYVYMRARYLMQLSGTLVSRSVIVTGLPVELRTDQALATYFETLGIGVVVSCHVVRHVKKLGHILRKRARALDKLEESYVKYWGNPCTVITNYHPEQIIQNAQRIHHLESLNDKKQPCNKQNDGTSAKTDQSSDNSAMDEMTSEYILHRTNKVSDTYNNTCKTVNNTIIGYQRGHRPQIKTGLFGLYGERVDAIDYYTKEFDHWDKMATEARASSEFNMTSVGFVTFEKMESALIASQIAICPVPFRCRTANAYEPRDVLWRNIHISGKQRVVRDILVWSATIALVIFWTVPISFISSFTSIDAIIKLAPGLGSFIDEHNFLQNIVQGLIPTLLVNIFMQVLPLVLDFLGVVQGLRARSAVSESTLSKYFFFLIFNVLLVFTIVSTAINTVVLLFERPTEIARILATSLPKVSPFFINYTILQGLLLMPLNLLLLGSLIVRGFTIYFLAKTPREHANARAPDSFNYGAGYPAPLLIFIIVLVYSTVAPIILIFGSLYFAITYVVYKYQFLYVYFRPYEAAGQLWTLVFPRIITGMIIFQLTMLGLFVLKDSYVLSGLCVPLIVLTLIFKFTIDAAYTRNSLHLPIQLLKEQTNVEEDSDNHNNVDIGIDGHENNQATNEATGRSNIAQDRWISAFSSIQNSSRHRFDQNNQQQQSLVQPRQRHMILDEDNYRATPDNKTDYRQPPMFLNPGVLDTGLKWYGNPYLVGELPHLWLPVRSASPPESSHPRPPGIQTQTTEGQHTDPMNDNDDLYCRNIDNYEQQLSVTATDIAQAVRVLEKSHHDNVDLGHVCINDDIQQPQHHPGPFSTGNSFGSHINGISKNSNLGNTRQLPNNDGNMDKDNSDDTDDDYSDNDNGANATSIYHRIYYHHPEQRHSSSTYRPSSTCINILHSTPSLQLVCSNTSSTPPAD
ncbi:hypothetical protein BCR42DRAFT_407637 [Absidia repens]|uniref:DUF221-domain-containing protein n=1 Tax=Absidia repens TaxID=90262 RepID=A0A1X2ISG8_9FUNG|nr:hypothetical protein BCR42DRAFT_407637 [Absidia repens]